MSGVCCRTRRPARPRRPGDAGPAACNAGGRKKARLAPAARAKTVRAARANGERARFRGPHRSAAQAEIACGAGKRRALPKLSGYARSNPRNRRQVSSRGRPAENS